MSDELARIYLKTLISIEENGQLVPASAAVLEGTVHVLTAWNPGDKRPTRDKNDNANERLHQLLVDRGLKPIRAVGADPDSVHFEESWAVIGLNDQQAQEIGAIFGQVAVFRVADGVLAVLGCAVDWSLSRPI